MSQKFKFNMNEQKMNTNWYQTIFSRFLYTFDIAAYFMHIVVIDLLFQMVN